MYPANFLFFALIFFSRGLMATGDSLNYLRPQDSVILLANSEAKLFLQHTIAPGQNAALLSRYYNLSENEFYNLNPHLNQRMIVGAVVQIPIAADMIVTTQPSLQTIDNHARVYFRVQKGDTAYGISKRIFSMPIDVLLQRNQISSEQIRIGQTLFIGWMPTVKYTPPSERNYAPSGEALGLEQQFRQAEEEKTIMLHKGPVVWHRDNRNGMFALHRFAPINSVIKVHNPNSRQSVYLKVIGRIPDSIYGDEVVAVVSHQAARLLRGVDQRFYVQLYYPAE